MFLLGPLEKDTGILKDMVKKYAAIREEGYARRLLFAFKESGDLADLRRKIGLHEQALQMWYMTVIVSSLGRIEVGVDEIKRLQTYKAMERIGDKKLEKTKERVLRNVMKRTESTSYSRPEVIVHSAPVAAAGLGAAALGAASFKPPRKPRPARMETYTDSSPPEEVTEADVKPLKDELIRNGLSEEEVEEAMGDAVEYLFANRRERQELEKEAKIEASKPSRVRPETLYDTTSPSRYDRHNYGSYATRPSQNKYDDERYENRYDDERHENRYDDERYETRPYGSRYKSKQRERSSGMDELRRSRSQREAPTVRIFTDDERAPPRTVEKQRQRASSSSGLEMHPSTRNYLTIESTPHFEGLEIPQNHSRRRASDSIRDVERDRSRSEYLVVPEASTRRRSVPSRNYFEDEIEFITEEDVERNHPRRPRIARSQSPRPGVTHYVVRSD